MCRPILSAVVALCFLSGCGKPSKEEEAPTATTTTKPPLTKAEAVGLLDKLGKDEHTANEELNHNYTVWQTTKNEQVKKSSATAVQSRIARLREILSEVEDVYQRVDVAKNEDKLRLTLGKLKDRRKRLSEIETEVRGY